MTEKEKAIEWLKSCKETNYRHSATIQSYIDMAISALKEEPVPFDFELFQAGLMDIPKGMTNGEVIQALFPQIELVEIYNGRHRFFLKGKESTTFDLTAEVKWLNAPYQKGGE